MEYVAVDAVTITEPREAGASSRFHKKNGHVVPNLHRHSVMQAFAYSAEWQDPVVVPDGALTLLVLKGCIVPGQVDRIPGRLPGLCPSKYGPGWDQFQD